MKKTAFMIALVAFLAVFMFGLSSAHTATSFVSDEAIVSVDGIDINHVHDTNLDIAGFAGETVPVRLYFSAIDNASEVEVEVELSSGSKKSTDSYFIGDVIADGRVYRTGVMNIDFPASLDETSDDLYLRVTITADGYETYFEEYALSVQRNSYELDLLSVDFDSTVSAGDSVPVSVVIKNRGYHDSQDGFVTVSIPELGISAKGYFGDLVAIEDCSSDCDSQDAIQKVLNLKIPSDAKAGLYDMTVKVYDEDSATVVTESIQVSNSVSSEVIAPLTSQSMSAGETKTYELILVNSADSVKVYTLKAVSGAELSVSVPTVVTVDAGSSKTVQVTVTASDDAAKGSYPFVVEVNGESTSLNATVSGTSSVSVSTIALTVVLVLVFVILLVVLIVLLMKKDKPAEEVETSYY